MELLAASHTQLTDSFQDKNQKYYGKTRFVVERYTQMWISRTNYDRNWIINWICLLGINSNVLEVLG